MLKRAKRRGNKYRLIWERNISSSNNLFSYWTSLNEYHFSLPNKYQHKMKTNIGSSVKQIFPRLAQTTFSHFEFDYQWAILRKAIYGIASLTHNCFSSPTQISTQNLWNKYFFVLLKQPGVILNKIKQLIWVTSSRSMLQPTI